ncbi:MAG: ABC transporter ATP-binding protein [Deltaproteobacteria bacterium]|jgi:iron complex transport system ATP-binding protein|nr:ABC transporter ATP-binding protein [Deltaproteobacteria bacterium]
MPEAPALSAKDVSFSHGPRTVVKNLSLDLYPGRHYILAGPNGAGKSTVLDLLTKLKKPDSGEILLDGRPLASFKAPELAKSIALAPQSSNFGFAFTVREVVRLGRKPHQGPFGRLGPGDERAVEEAIEKLHLGHLADKSVTGLSGGEAQRVVLARTLAQDTPIILLDEPTGSLDVAQALDFMETLRDLAQNGRLVVTVSHDLTLAATYAGQIVFMADGRLVAAGTREETLTPELLARVFEAEASVRRDDFTGGLTVSFRRRAQGRGGGPDLPDTARPETDRPNADRPGASQTVTN